MTTVARRIAVLALALTSFLLAAGSAQADPTIGDFTSFENLSFQRVSRTVVQYEYRATVSNDAPALENLTATVTSSSPNTVIVDGTLDFGDLAAGAAGSSSDSFSFRHDLRFPFDPAALHYQFQFDAVPANGPPTADAGPDQTAFVNQTVTLDASGSSDPDGDPLTYLWRLTGTPAGSAATLDDTAAIMPGFSIDLPGRYVAELIVNDGTDDSAPDSVTVDTLNSAPLADAGPDQTTFVTDIVTLDGSGSSDVDGDLLTYLWTLTDRPQGSGAALDDPTAVMPRFEIDRLGTYVAELIVNDGLADSDPDSVSVATENTPPVADAGSDQTPLVGETVTLDGSGSSDVDGDLLTFQWALTSKPAASGATLSDPTAVLPTITIDLPGTYIAQLVVNDGATSSAPDTVTIDTTTSAPRADAGPDQTVEVTDTVMLDGSGSSDVDGDLLVFTWSLTTVQAGSSAELSDPHAVKPTFIADLPGTYVAQLIVNDGNVDSAPDSVTISTENSAPVADAGPDQTVFLSDIVTLDGSGSSDADSELLTMRWSFTALPPSSGAVLSNAEATMPTFVVDQLGTYVAQLIVNDGTVDSAPDSVTLSTENSAPIAVAGLDQTVFVSDTVTLDGSGSSDVDGDPLTFLWSFTALPAGSIATLNDATAASPDFTVDLPGTYVAQLIVNDGIVNSKPNSTVIVTDNSPPVAHAGIDRNAGFGSRVRLDGSLSRDIDGDPLLYQWRLITVPAGSGAALDDPGAIAPGFDADTLGLYVAQLVVNDGVLSSVPDTVVVTVDPLGDITAFSRTIGAGLQFAGSAELDVSNHGGVTVRIESNDPAIVLVAPDSVTPGSAFIDVIVSDGGDAADYVVQGVASGSGVATITVSAPGFNQGAGTITVVQPALAISGLAGTAALGTDTDFFIQTGIPDGTGAALSAFQGVSAANVSPVIVTVTSSDGTVGRLIAGGTIADTVTLEPLAGEFQTQLTFTPLAGGTTTVSATSPGFLSATAASQDVTIDLPGISAFSRTIGAGLQFAGSASLDIADHGGVNLRIQSGNPAVALVAPDTVTPGSPFIDVFVPNGSATVSYVVQGVWDRVGISTITVSAPGFSNGVGIATIVQPGVTISGLSNSTSVGTDRAFFVQTGVPNGAGTALSAFQGMSAGNVPALELTVASSNGTVGQLTNGSSTGDSVAVTPAANGFQTLLTFTPRAAGTTTVSASGPRFLSVTTAAVEVTVDPPGISAFSRTIGAGLQFAGSASLDITNHGGVTVRIASGNPGLALIAPDAATPGSAFIDVVVANGSASVPYVVQGVAGSQGVVTVTASAPGFTDGQGTITVVQPALSLAGLSSNASVGISDAFTVFLGTPNAAGIGLASLQGTSAANVPPLELTMTSSNGAVGQVSAGGVTAATVVIPLPPGSFQPGVTFVPLTAGSTTVTGGIPGFLTTTGGSLAVTVNGP